MYVVLSIIKINKVLTSYFEEDIQNLFLNGYCLEYYELLKNIYPNAVMVIEKDKEHCAALIEGNVYDVSGIRNKDDFYVANQSDEDFVYSFYKRFEEIDRKNVSDLINGISKKFTQQNLK